MGDCGGIGPLGQDDGQSEAVVAVGAVAHLSNRVASVLQPLVGVADQQVDHVGVEIMVDLATVVGGDHLAAPVVGEGAGDDFAAVGIGVAQQYAHTLEVV